GAVLLALVLATYLYDHSRRDLIARCVRIDGVSVGGMHTAAARAKVERQLGMSLNRPVMVRAGVRTWTLGAHEAALRIEARKMVAQALAASREGSIFSRTARDLFGGSVNRD